jgi:hypothetical protein
MVPLSSLPIHIVVIAIISTASVSLITLGAVIIIYLRKKVQPLKNETLAVKIGPSDFGIEEGMTIPSSYPEAVGTVRVADEKVEIQVCKQDVSQYLTTGQEETKGNEFELKRTSSQDSACFTDPICRTCLNDTESVSDDIDVADIVITNCVHGLKRDWTRIKVSLPEVYTSSRESILDAVVSASVP